MRKRILAIGLISAVLTALLVSRVNGQTQAAPSLVVICGDCPGDLFKLTAERGMLLMAAGHENNGDLYFYSFTPGSSPRLIGHLPAVGRPIEWGRRSSKE